MIHRESSIGFKEILEHIKDLLSDVCHYEHSHLSIQKMLHISSFLNFYTHCQSFFQFLGQRFNSETMLEKQRISPIFKAFLRVVSGTNIKSKSQENDRKWV